MGLEAEESSLRAHHEPWYRSLGGSVIKESNGGSLTPDPRPPALDAGQALDKYIILVTRLYSGGFIVSRFFLLSSLSL